MVPSPITIKERSERLFDSVGREIVSLRKKNAALTQLIRIAGELDLIDIRYWAETAKAENLESIKDLVVARRLMRHGYQVLYDEEL